MIAGDVATAVTQRGGPFCRRRWAVVPNVSWGWNLDYEADLIAISKGGWADEIEIKVSRGDLLADRKKRKFALGLDIRIKRFWYAVPSELLATAVEVVESHGKGFGVIEVRPPVGTSFPVAVVARRAVPNRKARLTTEAERLKLLHLGVMRYWDLRMKTKEVEK